MNKNLKKYIVSLLLPLGLLAACDGDDNTGFSRLTPSSPSLAVSVPPSSPNFVEEDSTFEFTITLSEAQVVDVPIYIKATGGEATEGEDFVINNTSSRVIIPAYSTKGVVSISVKGDDLPESVETFTIQIGDERTGNAAMTPVNVKFTIGNYDEDDLPLHLSWATEYFDVNGDPVAPADAADMIFFITDMNGVVVEAVDGAAFEDFVIEGAVFPDGEYLLKAGIFAAINPGELGNAPVLDLMLDYSQVGKIEATTLSFADAFNTALVCTGNLFTLASLTKTGSTYTITKVGEATSVDVASFVGAYDADEPGYGVYTVNFAEGTEPGVLVVDNFWDSGYEVEYVLDVCGTVTIPEQAIAPYTVTGSGTYDATTKEMIVDYVVKNAAGATVDANTHTFTKQ